MNLSSQFLILSLSSILVTGCIEEVDDPDPIDESFLEEDAKSDAFGIRERSPEALGVLQLVNTAHYSLLHQAGIARDAIESIQQHRGGDYSNPFDNLVELDAVPYVGSGTFFRLLTYARDHGYVSVEPFDPATCTGAPISLSRLQQVTANGTGKFPTGATWVRQRQCSSLLGCGPWSESRKQGVPRDSTATYRQAENNRLVFDVGLYSSRSIPQRGGYSLDNIVQYKWSFLFGAANGVTTIGAPSGFFDSYYGSNVTSHADLRDVTVTFTDRCLRASGRLPQTQTQQEREVVFLMTY